jgi:excisionase family DNA binding protein
MRKLPPRLSLAPGRIGQTEDADPRLEIGEGLRNRLALPVPEVAKLLGISSAAVRNMIARGELPGRKIGGGTDRITYIIPTRALFAWLETGVVVPPEDAA